MITKDYVDETNNIFINGLEKITDSINYGALNKKQNLLKNKIYLNENSNISKKETLESDNINEKEYTSKLKKFEKYFEKEKIYN